MYLRVIELRQLKLQKKQEFSASLEMLNGTLESRSESAKETLKNEAEKFNDVILIGTRRNSLNTKIEPHNEDSKKLNVDGGTCLGFYCLSDK